MSEPQTTRATLLVKLRDGSDRQAWSDFVDLYSPVVYQFARRHGLQDADAADLVQEVMRSVAKSVNRFDPAKGRFRHWLMAVARHRLSDHWASCARSQTGTGDTAVLHQLGEIESHSAADEVWEHEYRLSLFRIAAQQVRNNFEEKTWRAFWLTNVEGLETQNVAQMLEMSEGAVYVAKSRVLAQLRRHIQTLQD